MTKAVERGQNWFGYYWTPTSIIGKHKMVKVPFGVPFAGREHWDNCLAQSEQDCANPRPSAYTESEVQTIVTKKFKEAGGPAVDYLSKRVFPGDVMNEMLVYMSDNQAGGADAAVEFLKKHEAIWTTWVSGDVVAKVKAALSSS
jgi:glycine betaine/proline transport system substrate-binding protein